MHHFTRLLPILVVLVFVASIVWAQLPGGGGRPISPPTLPGGDRPIGPGLPPGGTGFPPGKLGTGFLPEDGLKLPGKGELEKLPNDKLVNLIDLLDRRNKDLLGSIRLGPKPGQMYIDVVQPGYPSSRVEPIGAAFKIFGNETVEEAKARQQLVDARLLCSVIFVWKDAHPHSEMTVGNGTLIDPTHVLTARHVARRLRDNPKAYSAHLFDWDIRKTSKPLEIKNIVGEGEWTNVDDDPDMAIIRIEKPDRDMPAKFPTIAQAVPGPATRSPWKSPVFVIGSHQFRGLQPAVCLGTVVTSSRKRSIATNVDRTTFGTDTATFVGLSGSPCYDPKGNIIGLQSASGSDSYIARGEQRIEIKQEPTEWDGMQNWTWMVPLPSFVDRINKLVDKSNQ